MMSDQPISDLLLEIAYHTGEGILSSTLDHNMQVIGHDNKSVQLETLAKTHAIQSVYDQALHHIAPEKMPVSNSTGGNKV